MSVGGDLHALYSTLIGLGADGMTKRRTSAIAMRINNRAMTLMDSAQQQRLTSRHDSGLKRQSDQLTARAEEKRIRVPDDGL